MSADRLALGTLQAALSEARHPDDGRPALEVLAASLLELGVRATPSARSGRLIARDREARLRRLRSARRSESTVNAYRIAIDELLAWAAREERTGELFDEQAIVDHLDDYRQRLHPAPSTYHRRFLLLRRFMRWVSHRNGAPDPFLELQAPPKPRQESDWLTGEEFAALLDAAEHPARGRPGLAECDQLVLLTLAMTGLRRSELLGLDCDDVDLDRRLIRVRNAKGGRQRVVPIHPGLVPLLVAYAATRTPTGDPALFVGVLGRRLSPTILTATFRRYTEAAGVTKRKRITPHTLRHVFATELLSAGANLRQIQELLGHKHLDSTQRYTRVNAHQLRGAIKRLTWAQPVCESVPVLVSAQSQALHKLAR